MLFVKPSCNRACLLILISAMNLLSHLQHCMRLFPLHMNCGVRLSDTPPSIAHQHT
jgi:hypothetical protein